jgi:hypothetical protein
MASVLVKIDLGENVTKESLQWEADWFPYEDKRISIDSAYLHIDPEEDSFYLFDLIEIQD